MAFFSNILDTIGNTPLVRLEKLFPNHKVYAKLESTNLTGSMKARSALGMITAAEEKGDLKPGMTIIESTSGNLGYALAAIGIIKGYEVILVIDPKTDVLKRNILRAYGVTLEIVAKPDSQGAYQQSRINRVNELLKKIPNSWCPSQYNNPENVKTHYKSTGPEIYNDLNGKVDVVVGSIGTCGHLCGTAKYLKEKNPELKVFGVEPEGSIISGGNYHPYLVQGPGLNFVSDNFDSSIIENIIKVTDKDSFACAKELVRTEAILSGGSAGSVIHALKDIVKSCSPDDNIVMILADDGFRYAGNFYDDNWLSTHGVVL